MAVWAGEILTAQALNIDRVTMHIKARRTESLVGIWSRPIVSQQIFVSRNPLDIFNRKFSPTVGANRLAE